MYQFEADFCFFHFLLTFVLLGQSVSLTTGDFGLACQSSFDPRHSEVDQERRQVAGLSLAA